MWDLLAGLVRRWWRCAGGALVVRGGLLWPGGAEDCGCAVSVEGWRGCDG